MSPIHWFILLLVLFSLVKILALVLFLRQFKPKPLTQEQIDRFDSEDDAAFFEDEA